MFKVLLVDDEAIIRKGLRSIVNWEELQCVVSGEVENGLEGIKKIEEIKPDIIIADIKMPGMNGLDMIMSTKEIIPKCKIIILTGYRDFEYLQKAIQIGAFDYILKPSKIEDIVSVLGKAVEELRREAEKEAEINNLRKNFEEKLPELRQKLLYDIIFNVKTNKKIIQEELALYKMCLDKYFVVVIEKDETNEDEINENERQLYRFGAANTFYDTFKEDFYIYYVPLSVNRVIFVIQLINDNSCINTIIEKMESFQQILVKCFNFKVSIGISSMGSSPYELNQRLTEAQKALDYRFHTKDKNIISYDNTISIGEDESIIFHSLGKQLVKDVKDGEVKVVKESLFKIIDFIKENGVAEKSVKNLFANVVTLINEDESSAALDASIFSYINKSKSIEELSLLLEAALTKAAEKFERHSIDNVNINLKKAIEYIKMNYNNHITLNDLAEYTYISSSHLSRMFTSELGKSFTDYLNEIRIEKAKDYLKKDNYKAYEVADMVGIKDAHYFSKIFKKYTGVTPSEYREN